MTRFAHRLSLRAPRGAFMPPVGWNRIGRAKVTGGKMKTEKDKMLAGELYDPLDPELVQARERARDLCQELNATRERDQDARRLLLNQLFGQDGESIWIQPPLFCDDFSNNLV